MRKSKYIWFNGRFKKWNDAKIHVINHSLHYGTGAFEGMRFYNTKKGPAIFQLERHIDRWIYSAKCIHMKLPYTRKQLIDACIKTVKKNNLKSGYIRPISFYGYGPLRVSPKGLPVDVALAIWPWGSYLGKEAVTLKISPFVRIHPKSSYTDAKITGHYINAALAVIDANNDGFTEALMLDHKGYIAEGSAENIFIVKKGIIYTPPPESILAGVTRDSIMELAKDLGYKVREKRLKIEDIKSADECFLTGTAAEVSPVGKLDRKTLKTQRGPITNELKNAFNKVVSGKNSRYDEWLTHIS